MAETERIPTVGLALQGGGSHAAFTWGVLDRLLDEVAQEKLFIRAISGERRSAERRSMRIRPERERA